MASSQACGSVTSPETVSTSCRRNTFSRCAARKLCWVIPMFVQHHIEPGGVELTVLILQLRIGVMLRDISALERPSPIFFASWSRPGLGDHFTEHLTVKAERAGLVGRQRMTELAADLLQAIVVGFAGTDRSRFRSLPMLARVPWPKP